MQSCIPGDQRYITPVYNQSNDTNAVVTEISALLLDEEADYLIEKAKEKGLQRSLVIDDKEHLSSSRTSSTSFLGRGEDDVISCIEKRIATVAQQPVANLEPLQVTAYSQSQKYDPHHDYFHESDQCGKHGQRTMTVFSYLNTVDSGCGGATLFPQLENQNGEALRVFPTKGNAVMWSNRKTTGEPNEATLHGGEAVTCAAAQKYGLNAWFRDNQWA